MNVILSMAITPNGLIADVEGGMGWVSETAWKRFMTTAQRTGNVIMGKGAYDSLVREEKFPIPGCLNVVMTEHEPQAERLENVLFAKVSPEEVLDLLRERGMSDAFLLGGGELSGSFMTDGLVDEIVLLVEPVVIGQGIALFQNGEFTREVDLLGVQKVTDQEVELHYKVRR